MSGNQFLETSGIKETYLQQNNKITKEKLFHSYCLMQKQPSSIKNCIKNARENIRMVRTAVTLEVECNKFNIS